MLQEASEQAGLPLDTTAPEAPLTVGLESVLAQLDARLETTARTLAAAQQRLRRAVEASRQGNLRDLPGMLDSVVESSAAFAETAGNARHSWAFDGQRHLEEGAYVTELLSQAAAAGLEGAREVDGQLYSFPVIVKVDARDLSVKIGKKVHRNVRPSVVAALLRRMRSQPARDNTRQLVIAFERAYLAVTGGKDGVAVPLRRVYDLLVLRPGQGREYTEVDFMLDVYKLDRAGALIAPSGREMTLPASTRTQGGRGIRFVTETGEERLYSSIRFDSQMT